MNISMFLGGGDYKGGYSGATTYRLNDIVRYDGIAYQATKDTFSAVLPTDTDYWRKMVGATTYTGLTADNVEAVAASTTGNAVGTRKYWFGGEWVLEKPNVRHVRLKKVYRNCNCNCNCVQNCDCVANQPNCANCYFDAGDGLACNCACLFQSNCNYTSGYCNCSANCNDGNCYY
jgi:hypothetical protein